MDISALKSIKSILRMIELIFSIITFAVVAEYDGTGKINFTIFTGVTAMVICLFFLAMYAFELGDNPTIMLIELVVNCLWWVFWLATAACLASLVSSWSNSRINASCAFAWFTWAFWTGSTVISFRDVSTRRGGNMPAAPQPNVAMV